MVYIAAAGDVHGQIAQLFRQLDTLESDLGCEVEAIVQVGDFGIWPDPDKVDAATRKRNQVGDFPAWLEQGRNMPRALYFIAGNHEDFDYLQGRRRDELLPGLHFIPWGSVVEIPTSQGPLRVGGVGGCYSPSSFELANLHGKRRKHYSKAYLDQLEHIAGELDRPLDVLMFHDAPQGTMVDLAWNDTLRTSPAQGLDETIAALQPAICLTGHWHMRSERRIAGVRTMGLNIVPRSGSLAILEFEEFGREPKVVAEWNPPTPVDPSVRQAEAIALIVGMLEAWAEEIGELNRPQRKAAREHLRRHPELRLLMGALKGAQLALQLERSHDLEGCEQIVERLEGEPGLPDTAELRRVLGLA